MLLNSFCFIATFCVFQVANAQAQQFPDETSVQNVRNYVCDRLPKLEFCKRAKGVSPPKIISPPPPPSLRQKPDVLEFFHQEKSVLLPKIQSPPILLQKALALAQPVPVPPAFIQQPLRPLPALWRQTESREPARPQCEKQYIFYERYCGRVYQRFRRQEFCRNYEFECWVPLPPREIVHPAAPPPAPPIEARRPVDGAACIQWAAFAQQFCKPLNIPDEYADSCKLYNLACGTPAEDTDDLEQIAGAVDSTVGSGDQWFIQGIPFYPFNPEGIVGGGSTTNVDFGTWGGGVRTESGIRDFWKEFTVTGSNWYEGYHGSKSGWEIPILPPIRVQTERSAVVPINPSSIGEPIEVGETFRVGELWGTKSNSETDWWNGSVKQGTAWGLPFIGISGGTVNSVGFPSIGDFL